MPISKRAFINWFFNWLQSFRRKNQGLQNGDLIVVAGRPSMGKTSFAMNIAENFLVDEDVKGGILLSRNVGRITHHKIIG